MNVHSRPGELTPGTSPFGQTQSLLRFVACGSVDHGKSTLLGRLLYESKQLFADQLEALAADSRKYGTEGEDLDYSLLLDGLAAEREQNITIDVAYRFFSTPRRKFIVIDTPGHEQYSANMATGASVADLALVLVSANEGLTRQTRRHIAIVGMLGIGDVVLVVNKMDRAGCWRRNFATSRSTPASAMSSPFRSQRKAATISPAVRSRCHGTAAQRCSTIWSISSLRAPARAGRCGCPFNW